MEWDIRGDRPVFIQLIDQIKKFVISGKLHPGSKLPSVRDMAQDASVNPNTMQKALSILDEEGLLLPQSTTGRYITRDLELIARLRTSIASEKTKALISELLSLGYTPDEVLSVFELTIKKSKDINDRSDA